MANRKEGRYIIKGSLSIKKEGGNENVAYVTKHRQVSNIAQMDDGIEKIEKMKDFDRELGARGENMKSEGYRHSNLPGIHSHDVSLKKSGRNNHTERIECANCLNIFLADINGNRLLIDNSQGRFIVVKFVELIAVCPNCNFSCLIDLHDGPYEMDLNNKYYDPSPELDAIIDGSLEPYNLEGDFCCAIKKMNELGIIDPNRKQSFLREELIKDRRNKIS